MPPPPAEQRPALDWGHLTPARLSDLLRQVAVPREGREPIETRAPFSGEVIGRVPRGTTGDVATALAAARAAHGPWAATPAAERAKVFGRFSELLLERRAEGLDLIQLETGKARLDALEELADLVLWAGYLARNAPRVLRPRRRQGAIPGLSRAWEYRCPHGVVGVISPWNYPLNLSLGDSIAALAAGNGVVLKPDHQTTHVAAWGVALLREAGLPRGVLQLLSGIGPELGPALIAGVDHVMFTGSTATGRIIAQQAAERLIGCSLELGGKNPMIVLEDADLDLAIPTFVRGAFSGAGQVCVAIERVYIKAAIWDEFAQRAIAAVRDLRVGPGLDHRHDVGTLTSAAQLERVIAFVADARAHGARVLAGGRARPDLGPWFHEPTLLADVSPECRLFREEVFGPVVSLFPVESDAEAIARANDTPYGLNASLWTRDIRRGRALARQVRAGIVHVNDVLETAWGTNDMPIGGMKASGLGRRRGAEGLLGYTEAQAVLVERMLPRILARAPGPAVERWMAPVLRLLGHRPRIRR